MGNTRKTASGNYCKTLSAIQRSDQKLWPYSAVIPVWRDKTSFSTSRDSIGNTRKRPPETTVKLLARSNGRIKRYGPFQLLFRSGETRPPIHRVGIPSVIQGKQPPETSVKLSWRSNGRIKSDGPFELLFWSGATTPPIHWVGIPSVIQGKQPPKTTVKLWARSNGRIKSYGPIQLLFRSGATRPPIHRVGIP